MAKHRGRATESDRGFPLPRRHPSPGQLQEPPLYFDSSPVGAFPVRVSFQNPSPARPSSTHVGTLLPQGLCTAVPLPQTVSTLTPVPIASPLPSCPSLLTWRLLNTTYPAPLLKSESCLALPSPRPLPFLGFVGFVLPKRIFSSHIFCTYLNRFLSPLLGCQLQEGRALGLLCSQILTHREPSGQSLDPRQVLPKAGAVREPWEGREGTD